MRLGWSCDALLPDDRGWGFFVAPDRAPVWVVALPAPGPTGEPRWQVTATYEGGLSSLWGDTRLHEGTALARRVEAAIRDEIAGRAGIVVVAERAID